MVRVGQRAVSRQALAHLLFNEGYKCLAFVDASHLGVVCARRRSRKAIATGSPAPTARDFLVEKRAQMWHRGVGSAPPGCSTVIFRRFEKCLILKDFFAVPKRWRRGRASHPSYRTLGRVCRLTRRGALATSAKSRFADFVD